MNKIVFVTFLAVICLSNCKTAGQEIIQGLFDVFSIESQIDDNCFGERFFEMINAELKDQNPSSGLFLFSMLEYELFKNCLIEKFLVGFGSLVREKREEGTLFNNFIKKIKIALQLFIKEMKSNSQTPKSFGTALGYFLLTFIVEEEYINILDSDHIKLSMFNILRGVLKGLSKDENSTKCHNNVVSHRELVTKYFDELLNKNKEDRSCADDEKFSELLDIAGDCRLIKLYVLLKNIGKHSMVIIEKSDLIESEFKKLSEGLFQGLREEKDYQIGYTLGKFFNAVLDFYVD